MEDSNLKRAVARILGLTLILVVCLTPIALHAAETTVERYALVIGNSDYDGNALLNPRNDALDMAEQLNVMGYQIHSGGALLDLSRLDMEQAVVEFARSLPRSASALFYYAGHGMATKDDNFLIPINHQLQFQEQLRDRTVSLRSVVEIMKNANPEGINVLLLDACRDNPLVRSFRSSQTGLQRLVDIPRGIFIGYAADSGQVAEDGVGRNGTYTSELLKVMAKNSNIIVEVAHKEVAKNVYEKTQGQQFPVSENKVYGNWCFATCKSVVVENNDIENTNDSVVAQTTTQPRIEIKPKSNTWKIVGGVVLGLVVAGLLIDDDNDPSNENPDSFNLIIPPPADP